MSMNSKPISSNGKTNVRDINGIDSSIIRISKAISMIYDRMFELYSIYLPPVLEKLDKNLQANENAINESIKNKFRIFDSIDNIPFTVLCKIIDKDLYETLLTKISDVTSSIAVSLSNEKEEKDIKNIHRQTYSNDIVSNLISEGVDELQNFSNYELDFISLGNCPNYREGTLFACNLNGNNSFFSKRFDINEKESIRFALPIITILNKSNNKIFEDIFKPITKIMISPEVRTDLNAKNINSNNTKYNDKIDEFLFLSSEKLDHLFATEGNHMIVDIDTLFESIQHLICDMALLENEFNKDSLKDSANDNIFSNYIRETKYGTMLRMINKIKNNNYLSDKFLYLSEIHKNVIKGSSINTYLANVAIRLNDYSKNYLDDLVNKYLMLSTWDFEVRRFKNLGITSSVIRERAWTFYSLFRNVISSNDPGRYMLNWDDGFKAPNSSSLNKNSKLQTPTAFVYYVLKKIYEHENATYNISFNIVNNENSFIFKETIYLAKSMYVNIRDRNAKMIMQTLEDYLTKDVLIGNNQIGKEKLGLYNAARNHRAISSLYKQLLIMYIHSLEIYKNTRSLYQSEPEQIRNFEEIKSQIKRELHDIQFSFNRMLSNDSLKNVCDNLTEINTNGIELFYYKPLMSLGLFYNDKWNIHRDMLENGVLNRNNLILFNENSDFLKYMTNNGRIKLYELANSSLDLKNVEIHNNTRHGFISDFEDSKSRIVKAITEDSGTFSNPRLTPGFKSDFGQYDTQINSAFNSVESNDNKFVDRWGRMKLDLDTLKRSSENLLNNKIRRPLDIITIAFNSEFAYRAGSNSKEDLEILDEITDNLREVCTNRYLKRQENYDNSISSESLIEYGKKILSDMDKDPDKEDDKEEIAYLDKVISLARVRKDIIFTSNKNITESDLDKYEAEVNKLYNKYLYESSDVVRYYFRNIGSIKFGDKNIYGYNPKGNNDALTITKTFLTSGKKIPDHCLVLENYDDVIIVFSVLYSHVYEIKSNGIKTVTTYLGSLGSYIYNTLNKYITTTTKKEFEYRNNYEIEGIRLGYTSRSDLRKRFLKFEEYQKTSTSKNITDYFDNFSAFYNSSNKVVYLEFYDTCIFYIRKVDVFSMRPDEIIKLISSREDNEAYVDNDNNFVSKKMKLIFRFNYDEDKLENIGFYANDDYFNIGLESMNFKNMIRYHHRKLMDVL